MTTNMKKKSYSYSYLVPLSGINGNILNKQGLINAYLKDEVNFPDEPIGKYIYLLFSNDIFSIYKHYYDPNGPLAEKFKEIDKDYQIYSLDNDDEYTMIKIEISERDRKRIVEPFLAGKYSKIDRMYVTKYFPEYIAILKPDAYGYHEWRQEKNKLYQVLTADPELRLEMERELDNKIPEDTELKDIPDIDLETFKK